VSRPSARHAHDAPTVRDRRRHARQQQPLVTAAAPAAWTRRLGFLRHLTRLEFIDPAIVARSLPTVHPA